MIRIAALGTSSIVRRTFAAASVVDGLSFTSICSRDAVRAAALASDLGVGRSSGDFAALLADPDVDAVYVATPNARHGDQVRACLEAGKHVLVEKPAVQTASEWDALVARASEQGLVLLENMRTAHDPVMARIIELLGTLGAIRQVAFHFSQRSARYDELLAGRPINIFDPALGGGALNDLGVYLTHPLGRMFSMPTRAAASMVRVSTGADGAGAALLTYPGMVAQLSWSKMSAGRFGGSIEGEQGTITIDHMTELYGIRVDYTDGRVIEERPSKESDNITYALRRFVAAADQRVDVTDDQSWTRVSLELLDQIRAAAG